MPAAFALRVYRVGLVCDRVLERTVVRALLSVAIIASLLPVPWLERLDAAFAALFLLEFVVRVLAVVATTQPDRGAAGGLQDEACPPGRSRVGAVALLSIDALALLSFLPSSAAGGSARWLRVVRLLRLLALAGYWSRLLADTWEILARRERLRQVGLMGVVVGGVSLAGAVVLHHVHDQDFDADYDGDVDGDDRSFAVLLWWSFRQVQDPGNMLESPHAATAVVVSLGLTVLGLLLVSFLIGLGGDVVRELVEHSRNRPPGWRGHSVIVNFTPSTRRLLQELLAYYRKLFPSHARVLSRRWFADLRRRGVTRPRFVVVGDGDEVPEALRGGGFDRVAYRGRPGDEEALLTRADLVSAKRVVLLASERDRSPDAETIRTLLTLVERVRARERRRGAPALGRTRVAVVEIRDDSNVAAARAALATAGESFRGWVVPTEKLLGLFFAGVARRPGLGTLLSELLTSAGHEIYTCFFDTPGLGLQVTRPQGLGGAAGPVMTRLGLAGERAAGGRGPVIPIGLLLDAPAGAPRPFDVALNPAPGQRIEGERVRGLVGLAADFGAVQRWLSAWCQLGDGESTPAAVDADAAVPSFARTRRPKTTHVLVCGFRAGTIYMLEELFRSDPRGDVLVLVDDPAAHAAAAAAIDAHTQLVSRGLLAGRHGVFERVAAAEYQVRMPESHGVPGRLRLEVADWMASRTLVDLPAGFGHVEGLDAVVFVAGAGSDDDPRTTTALLKLEQLCLGPTPPAVVAELFDAALASRLAARARALGQQHVQIYSSQELRAFFLFQAVVVPGFDTVYEELLGAWGQSLVHMHVEQAQQGPCSFDAVAARFAAQGHILIAIELDDGSGPRLFVAPARHEPGGRFDARRLVGAWVVAPDSGDPAPAVVAAPQPAALREPA